MSNQTGKGPEILPTEIITREDGTNFPGNGSLVFGSQPSSTTSVEPNNAIDAGKIVSLEEYLGRLNDAIGARKAA